MTDYNDGKWHRWNGGECPVHPKSTVQYFWQDPNQGSAGQGGERQAVEEGSVQLAWPHVIAFRVVKEHREPREFWIVAGCEAWDSEREAREHALQLMNGAKIIHVREVLDE